MAACQGYDRNTDASSDDDGLDAGGARELPLNLGADLDALEQAIGKVCECKLVIIDPVSAYLPGSRHFDSHRNTDVRAILAPLGELAARCRVAVVAVTHLRKSDGPAVYRSIGSLAFVAAARLAWAVAKDRDDAAGRRRLLLPLKSNLSADSTGLAFAVEGVNGVPLVRWEPGAVTISADDALGTGRGHDAGGATAETADRLGEALADGPVSATEIKRRASADGIAPRTLDRAKLRLGVTAAPSGYRGPWVWALADYITQQADGADGAHSAPTAPECANYPSLAHSGKSGALWAGSPDDRRLDNRPPSYILEPPAPPTNAVDDRPPDSVLEDAAAGAGLDGEEVPL